MKTRSIIIIAGVLVAGVLLAAPDLAAAQTIRGKIPGETGEINLDAEIDRFNPKQLKELMSRAAAARLKVERDTVAAEIKSDLLYEKKDKDAALKILTDNPADTQADNIARICRAFAATDEAFANAYRFFSTGKYDQAVKRAKAILDPQKSTYLSAASHYVYAETLFRRDSLYDAVEAYSEILRLMPDRFSFASKSASRCAQIYEKMKRFRYAAEIYAYCLRNYGVTLSEKETRKITERLEYLQEIAQDPLGALASRIGQVRSRLEEADSGKVTQTKQEEIVAILTDLIKTAEEKPQSKPKKKPKKKKKKGKGQGEKQGKAKAKAKGARSQGKPSNKSSKPMQRSMLPGGIAQRPKDTAKVHRIKGSDGWAELPPSEREQIEKAMQKLLPERYKQLIRDYRKQLSKGAEPEE